MSPNTTRLLLATTSRDKIRELRGILQDLPLELLSPPELGLSLEVDETGQTFRANADLKARAYHAASGLPCLAEDSGFEVAALDGAPGVYSARWEGEDYVHKNALIIQRLSGLIGAQRRCRYVCAMVLVDQAGRLHRASGALDGRVADVPAGSGGFGYDPIFLLPRRRLTLAQIEAEEKNLLSHRARAAQKLRAHLERLAQAG